MTSRSEMILPIAGGANRASHPSVAPKRKLERDTYSLIVFLDILYYPHYYARVFP